MYFLVFLIDDQQFAFDLSTIERVIPVVELTSLPNAPKECMGAINMHGSVIPAIDMRKTLNLPGREIDLSDHLLICTVFQHKVALWIDSVKKVINISKEDLIEASQVFPNVRGMEYVIKDAGQLILVFDINTLLPIEAISATMQATHI